MFGNLNTPHFLMVVFSIQIYCQQSTVICSSSFGVHLKWLRAKPVPLAIACQCEMRLGGKNGSSLSGDNFLKV